MSTPPEPNSLEGHYYRPAAPPRIPWWVQVSIWGSPNRAWVTGFGWFSLACAGASLVLGFVFPPAFIGVLMVFAALPYFAATRWMDRNNAWPGR